MYILYAYFLVMQWKLFESNKFGEALYIPKVLFPQVTVLIAEEKILIEKQV